MPLRAIAALCLTSAGVQNETAAVAGVAAHRQRRRRPAPPCFSPSCSLRVPRSLLLHSLHSEALHEAIAEAHRPNRPHSSKAAVEAEERQACSSQSVSQSATRVDVSDRTRSADDKSITICTAVCHQRLDTALTDSENGGDWADLASLRKSVLTGCGVGHGGTVRPFFPFFPFAFPCSATASHSSVDQQKKGGNHRYWFCAFV